MPKPKPVRAMARPRTGDEEGSFRSPLARLLDVPDFARLVPHLAPETLHQLIQKGGLDACGELVALATPGQLKSVLDVDLWRNPQAGLDEQFDADRFGEWIEMLMDTDSAVAARVVASLDEHLVVVGLSRYVRVFDVATTAPAVSSDDEPMDTGPTPESYECAVGGYLVRAIRPDGWDSIVGLLLALDAGDPRCFHALMRGCRRLSDSLPEIDGLDDLLPEPEQRLHDAGLDREHRRSEQGYSTPADARAFLQMARQGKRDQPGDASSTNPIAAAYLRAADDAAASQDHAASASPRRSLGPASTDGSIPQAVDALVNLLVETGLVPERPRALLEGATSKRSRLARISTLMAYVRDTDEVAYADRSRELAFLANTLMAGCSIQSRAFTPQEASDAAIGVCNLGLEHWPSRWLEAETRDAPRAADPGAMLPDTFLLDHDLVKAFEVGWAALHEDVSLFVAGHLIDTLTKLRCVDAEIQRGLNALRRELVKQRRAGTPWAALDALDVIALLDTPSWAALRGLLDECPVVHAALSATLEGHTGAVSPTKFEFISTTSQIAHVRAFMAKLLDVLTLPLLPDQS